MLTACVQSNAPLSAPLSEPQSLIEESPNQTHATESTRAITPSKQSTESSSSKSSSQDFQIFNTETETGFIRPDGQRIVLSEKYDEIHPFSHNRSIVRKDGKYGVVDVDGNKITELEFDLVNGGGQEHIYDELQRPIFQPRFLNGHLIVTFFKNYEIPIKVPYNIMGVIDIHGNYIIEPKYNDIKFDERTGLYNVKNLYRKYGMLTQDGDVSIPVIYDLMSSIDDSGLFKVMIGDKWGYLNAKNEEVIPIEYAWIDDFNEEGLAIAETTHIIFSEEDIGLGGDFAVHSSQYISSERIINRTGEVLYDSGVLFLVVNEDGSSYRKTLISLLGDNMAKVPDVESLPTVEIDINGYWGQPDYAPFIGDYEIGKSMEETPVPPVRYGQFQNEPIYKVIVWDDSIPYKLIKLS